MLLRATNDSECLGSTHIATVSNATTLLSFAVPPNEPPPQSNVPEPDSLVLAGAGALALALSRPRVARKATAA